MAGVCALVGVQINTHVQLEKQPTWEKKNHIFHIITCFALKLHVISWKHTTCEKELLSDHLDLKNETACPIMRKKIMKLNKNKSCGKINYNNHTSK